MIIRDKETLLAFLQAIKECKGEVIYLSGEGDRLNLKSVLSQFLFSSVFLDNPSLLNGKLSCEREEDLALLQPYLEG